jgi:hypothetical protein
LGEKISTSTICFVPERNCLIKPLVSTKQPIIEQMKDHAMTAWPTKRKSLLKSSIPMRVAVAPRPPQTNIKCPINSNMQQYPTRQRLEVEDWGMALFLPRSMDLWAMRKFMQGEGNIFFVREQTLLCKVTPIKSQLLFS